MSTSRWLVPVVALLAAQVAHATPLKIKDGPFVWMRATLTEQAGGLVLEGDIRRTAPRTVRTLRGHVHLYLDAEDGRELSSFTVPYFPAVLSRSRQPSSFAMQVPTQDRPVAVGRLEHHLEAGD